MKEKLCYKCKKILPITFFSTKGSEHQPMCKECNKGYQREHYLNNKPKYIKKARDYKENIISKLRDLKSLNPCKNCDNYFHFCQMDFDHITNDKSFNISKAAWYGKSWQAILKEIEKCELVCANCHRLRTFQINKVPIV